MAFHNVYLTAGWNNIAYPGKTLPIEEAVASIIDYLVRVEYGDAATGIVYFYDPGDPGSDLHQMVYGRAYWIQVTQAVTWIYPLPEEPPVPETAFASIWDVWGKPATAKPGDEIVINVRIKNTGAEGSECYAGAYDGVEFSYEPLYLFLEPSTEGVIVCRATMPNEDVTFRISAGHWDGYNWVHDSEVGPFNIISEVEPEGGLVTLFAKRAEEVLAGAYEWRLRQWTTATPQWSDFVGYVPIDEPLVWQTQDLTGLLLDIYLHSEGVQKSFQAGPFNFVAGGVYTIDLATLELEGPPVEPDLRIGSVTFYGKNFPEGVYAWDVWYFDANIQVWLRPEQFGGAVDAGKPLVIENVCLEEVLLMLGIQGNVYQRLEAIGPFDFVDGGEYTIDLEKNELTKGRPRAFPLKWVGVGAAAIIGALLAAKSFKK